MLNVFQPLAPLTVDYIFSNCKHAAFQDCGKPIVLSYWGELMLRHRRNKVHHLDHDTDEDMVPIFREDVNGTPLNNQHLLPRRNWCSIVPVEGGEAPFELLATLHVEVDCQKPDGTTKPYPLRIPALSV